MMFGPSRERSPTSRPPDADRTNAGAGRWITWNVDRGSMVATAPTTRRRASEPTRSTKNATCLDHPRARFRDVAKPTAPCCNSRAVGPNSRPAFNACRAPPVERARCLRSGHRPDPRDPDARSSQMLLRFASESDQKFLLARPSNAANEPRAVATSSHGTIGRDGSIRVLDGRSTGRSPVETLGRARTFE